MKEKLHAYQSLLEVALKNKEFEKELAKLKESVNE